VQAHTPPGSVIAFAKPRALALLGGRPGWIWNPDYGADVFRAKLQRSRASFLITVAPGTCLYERYPAYLDSRFQDAIGTTVFRNAIFRVIELRDPSVRTPSAKPLGLDLLPVVPAGGQARLSR
jgi:hypothetical protein